MSKFNVGDRVVISDPAYLVSAANAKAYVSPDAYGKPATVTRVNEEDEGTLVGQAYVVRIDGGTLSQTISQRYLTAAPAAPALPDGVYRETGGDIVLVRDGKAVEILETNDGCPRDNVDHLSSLSQDNYLSGAVRLVAADRTATSSVPDGVYTDSEGDVVHVKDNKVRYFNARNNPTYYEDDLTVYGPYIPLVEEDSTK